MLCYIPQASGHLGVTMRPGSWVLTPGMWGGHAQLLGKAHRTLASPLHHRLSGEDSKGIKEGGATGWREPGSLSDTEKSLLADSCSATESWGAVCYSSWCYLS